MSGKLSVLPLLLLMAAIGSASGATPSTITISASLNPVVFGQPAAVTALVSPSGATGKVTFYDGTTVLGVRPVTGGQAVLTTSLLASGARALKARYDGDATYAASTSVVVTETVTALPGNGFVTGLSYPTYGSSSSVAIADFNGDGKADIITGTQSGTVSVLLGDGQGGFAAGVDSQLAEYPTSLAVGDFNGDGKPDIVVVVSGGSIGANLEILLGNGDGTFQPGPVLPGGNLTVYLVVGDFNGDGNADIAIASSLYDSDATVSILLGNVSLG